MLCIEAGQMILHGDRCLDGPGWMIFLRIRGTEESDHRIADIFVEGSILTENLFGESVEEGVEQLDHLMRLEAL